MHVRIDEPRSDGASFRVDHRRRFTHPVADLQRGIHSDKLVSEDREGLGSRAGAVDRDYVPIQDHEISPDIGFRLAGAQSQADAQQAEMPGPRAASCDLISSNDRSPGRWLGST